MDVAKGSCSASTGTPLRRPIKWVTQGYLWLQTLDSFKNEGWTKWKWNEMKWDGFIDEWMHEWMDGQNATMQAEWNNSHPPTRPHSPKQKLQHSRPPISLEQPIGPHGQKPQVRPASPTRPLPACLRTIATGRIYNPQPHDLATGDAVPAHRTNNVNTGLMNRPSLEGHMVPCQIFPVSPLNNKQPCTLNPIGFDKIWLLK